MTISLSHTCYIYPYNKNYEEVTAALFNYNTVY